MAIVHEVNMYTENMTIAGDDHSTPVLVTDERMFDEELHEVHRASDCGNGDDLVVDSWYCSKVYTRDEFGRLQWAN